MKGLHLGSGGDLRTGWVNIDQKLKTRFYSDQTVALGHDIANGLPFDAGFFDLIYSSHFFEHLETMDGFNVIRECFRVLKGGGIFRCALPDARQVLKAYWERDQSWFQKADGFVQAGLPPSNIRSPIDYITRDARAWGHQCLYDFEKINRLLGAAGFVDIRECEFDPELGVDTPVRRAFSLYTIARRP